MFIFLGRTVWCVGIHPSLHLATFTLWRKQDLHCSEFTADESRQKSVFSLGPLWHCLESRGKETCHHSYVSFRLGHRSYFVRHSGFVKNKLVVSVVANTLYIKILSNICLTFHLSDCHLGLNSLLQGDTKMMESQKM